MIGIIGAMAIEVKALKKMIEEPETKIISGIEFWSGKINGKDVVVAECGIGKVFAGICAEIMILEYKPDFIINTGVGGTLTDKLGIGDIAVASRVCQHDMDTTPIGDPRGLLGSLGTVYVDCDEGLVKKVSEACTKLKINHCVGTIATGDQFISSNEQRDFIRANFENTVSCEMEGGAIGQVCMANKVPFVIVRAISDNANGGAPADFGAVVKAATKNNIAVLNEAMF